jgi:streptogramin lyase
MRLRVGVLAVILAALGWGTATAVAHEPTVTEFQGGLTLKSKLWGLVDGGDRSLWFTQDALNAFGAITAGDGLVSEFTERFTVGDHPRGITKGPDGNLWIAESGSGGAIARVTKAGGVTEFNAAPTSSHPWDVTAGPDGNVWFVSREPAFVGRITPDGKVTQFTTGLTPKSQPSAITAGPDGNLWFAESADPGRIGRITPAGVITEYSTGLTPKMEPTDITAGPDGNLWFALTGDPGAIGRITTDGKITEYRQGLSPTSRPTGVAAGTDGAVWFTESASPGRVGRITKSGEITEYTSGLTPGRAPWMITPGSDGNMWFTENADPGAIARISLPPTVRSRATERLSDDSVLLGGRIRSNAQVTEFYFEYWEAGAAASRSESDSAGAGWDPVEVSAELDDVKPETTYYYRVVATNDSGTTIGPESSFSMSALKTQLGEAIFAQPTGRVRFKRPRGRWRPLPDGGAGLPVGVAFDTRLGSVRLTTAMPGRRTQTGTFGGGVFNVRQSKRARGRVDLHLRGGSFAACRRTRAGRPADVAVASRSRRVRRLWGRDRGGKFRTYGRHSHATVRGTRWLTEDRCNGTFTRVTRGAVVVRDTARRRNVLVRAGHSYLARRPRR